MLVTLKNRLSYGILPHNAVLNKCNNNYQKKYVAKFWVSICYGKGKRLKIPNITTFFTKVSCIFLSGFSYDACWCSRKRLSDRLLFYIQPLHSLIWFLWDVKEPPPPFEKTPVVWPTFNFLGWVGYL